MKRLIYLIVPTILFTACIKKSVDKINSINGVKWTGAYAAPLLNLDMNIDDGVNLGKGILGIGNYNDNLIYLLYDQQETSTTGKQIVDITNQNDSLYDKLNGTEESSLISNGVLTVQRNTAYTWQSPSGDELDSFLFNSGIITVSLNNQYNHTCNATITFPDLLQGGQPAAIQVAANPNSTGSGFFNPSGLTLNLSKGGAGYNHLRYSVTMNFIKGSGGFSAGDHSNVKISISPVYKRAYGYFNTQKLMDAMSSFEITLFSGSNNAGDYSFNDPRVKVLVNNPTGIPLNLKLNALSAIDGNGTHSQITSVPPQTSIAAATLNGGPNIDSVMMTKSNSNTKTLIDNKPKKIGYDVELIGNPNGKTGRNFIDANAVITLTVSLELPLWGETTNMELTDTSDFSLDPDNEFTKYIDWIILRNTIENDFPLNIGVQGYFTDSNYNVLDSLFDPFRYLVKSATVDGSGTVIASTHDQYDIRLDRPKIERVNKATRLITRITLPTAQPGGTPIPVKIKTGQHFRMKLGIHAKFSANEKF